MKVGELFDIKYGINLELDACEIATDGEGVNFIGRTSENNGVVAKVKPIGEKPPQSAGALTCAGGGSVLSTFPQNKPFYSGRDLYVLTPKKEMSFEEKLFYCHCIKMNAFRYSYGRQANRTLKDINLPPLPYWLKNYRIDYSRIATKIKRKEMPFNVSAWGEFKVGDFFECVKAKSINSNETGIGNVPYVTRSAANNGVVKFIDCEKYTPNTGNCITIGGEGIIAFYQPKKFATGVNICTLRNENLNKFNALFVCTVLNKNNYKYSYGRPRTVYQIIKETIQLPSTGNAPDWGYMEQYIKSLPYSDKI